MNKDHSSSHVLMNDDRGSQEEESVRRIHTLHR